MGSVSASPRWKKAAYEQMLARLRTLLPPTDFDEEWNAGTALHSDEALESLVYSGLEPQPRDSRFSIDSIGRMHLHCALCSDVPPSLPSRCSPSPPGRALRINRQLPHRLRRYRPTTLVRYDLPRGLSDGFAPTRQPARRKDGADAVDWPAFTLNGQPLWAAQSEANVPLKLRKGNEVNSPFRLPGDDLIEPGGHWLRFMEWPAGPQPYLHRGSRRPSRRYGFDPQRTLRTVGLSHRGEG